MQQIAVKKYTSTQEIETKIEAKIKCKPNELRLGGFFHAYSCRIFDSDIFQKKYVVECSVFCNTAYIYCSIVSIVEMPSS